MNDTSPAIERRVRALIMQRSGSERFVMGARMFEAARSMVLASLPKGLDERELRRLLYERIYGVPLPFSPDDGARPSSTK